MTPDERAHEIVLQFRRGIIDTHEDLESVIGSAIIAAEADARAAAEARAGELEAALRYLVSTAEAYVKHITRGERWVAIDMAWRALEPESEEGRALGAGGGGDEK